MSKRFLALTLVCLSLTGCGYQGSYRYPCQDPNNWETKECKPPVCEVLGTCPEYIVGKDIVSPSPTPSTDGTTNNG